ncbi:MAG: P-loop NTPase [Deltaproteobacteria bacterium]
MPEARPQAPGVSRQAPIEGVARILAVSSAKGGVGKSTVAVNLALALRDLGLKVGLADMDIYGPSAPMMLGISGQPRPGQGELIPPLSAHGIKVISMGLFLDDDAPVIWRGPMAMSATKQFLRGVEWGELDVLVIDLPPGTGDIVLTLAQEVPIDGTVIVTTPQDVALADVRRGIAMLAKVNAPVLGMVQNMAGYVCSNCGTRDDIFGERPAALNASELGVPLLAELPLVPDLVDSGDAGTPLVVSNPGHAVSRIMAELAVAVCEGMDKGEGASRGPEPADIEHNEERSVLRIRWSDGVTTEYTLAGLRGWCPCASCQGHGSERNFVSEGTSRLSSFEGVGRYALRLLWDDGHSTGMYAYSYLREIAEFPECRPS